MLSKVITAVIVGKNRSIIGSVFISVAKRGPILLSRIFRRCAKNPFRDRRECQTSGSVVLCESTHRPFSVWARCLSSRIMGVVSGAKTALAVHDHLVFLLLPRFLSHADQTCCLPSADAHSRLTSGRIHIGQHGSGKPSK